MERKEIIAKNISWLAGKCMSYIDVTIEDSGVDKHSKKVMMKKLFNEQVYGLGDYLLDNDDIGEGCKRLLDSLARLVVTAIGDKSQRSQFVILISRKINEFKNRFNDDLLERMD